MTEMEREEGLAGEDRGVKIEIHDGDEPEKESVSEVSESRTDSPEAQRTEEKPEDTRSGTEKDGSSEDSSESEEKNSSDTAAERSDPETSDSSGNPDIKAAEDESVEGSSESDGSGSGSPRAEDSGKADSGKDSSGAGFFGFRNRKDKKDEKIEELTDRVKRQMAEFDNFRKRTDREKAAMFDMGKKDVIEKILPIVDSFERGLGEADKESADPFHEGMRKVYKQLTTALEELGVRPIEAVGKPFDPNFHNAVMHCEDESAGENMVVQEFQKGYMLNDTVIRHSMVKVAN